MSRLSGILALTVALSSLSCSDEVVDPPVEDFKQLTRRDHVIQHLQASYQQGDIGQIDRVLHESFTFCFTKDQATHCWPRDDELAITGGAINAGAWNEISFAFAAGEDRWVPNSTDPRHGESIWEKVVDYTIRRERTAQGTTVLNGRATFLVRGVRFEDANRWQLTGIADHAGHWGNLKEPFVPEN